MMRCANGVRRAAAPAQQAPRSARSPPVAPSPGWPHLQQAEAPQLSPEHFNIGCRLQPCCCSKKGWYLQIEPATSPPTCLVLLSWAQSIRQGRAHVRQADGHGWVQQNCAPVHISRAWRLGICACCSSSWHRRRCLRTRWQRVPQPAAVEQRDVSCHQAGGNDSHVIHRRVYCRRAPLLQRGCPIPASVTLWDCHWGASWLWGRRRHEVLAEVGATTPSP